MIFLTIHDHSGKGSLESGIVVSCDLVGDVVVPLIGVVVVVIGASHQGAGQLLRVGVRAVVGVPVAGGGLVGAGGRPVVGALGRVASEADHEAAAGGAEDVVHLALAPGADGVSLDAQLGSLGKRGIGVEGTSLGKRLNSLLSQIVSANPVES